ncbi:MAG: cellulose binding domain-containing protein, partial [Cyanobacteria bacterium J06628_4]
DAVDFAIAKDWWGGFTANVSFTYSGTEPLESWQLRFESPFEISKLWHGEIVSHSVEQTTHIYTVSNASWNGTLVPGDTITLGLNGKGSSVYQPSNYYFNNLPVGDAVDQSVTLDLPITPVEEPGVEPPAAEAPPVEEPVAKKPAIDEPEAPAAEEPGVEEPPAEEPPVEEPVAEQPPVEEPPVEEPPVEEPVAEQPPVEEPPVEEPPVEEPPVEEPVA